MWNPIHPGNHTADVSIGGSGGGKGQQTYDKLQQSPSGATHLTTPPLLPRFLPVGEDE